MPRSTSKSGNSSGCSVPLRNDELSQKKSRYLFHETGLEGCEPTDFMKEPTLCPTCGNQIPADAPEGVCPACALGRGFGIGTSSQLAADEAVFRRAEMDTL